MVEPRGKFSNVRYPDAWKILSSDHLLHVERKNKGAM